MSITRPSPSNGRLLSRLHVPEALLRHMGWTTGGYLLANVVRFANNLVLTRILAPELFGIMVLLISLRIGFELFTDIGVGQNVIANKDAFDPDFYNTAWTLQILRGVALAVVALAVIPIISHFYKSEQLSSILPFLSVFFILSGVTSIGHPLAVKAFETKRNAIYEFGSTLLGSIAMIASALVAPNLWGLLAGNILSTLAASLTSYLILPNLKYKLTINKLYAREMVRFGKWIFVSSIVYYLAMNLDRLMLPRYVSFTMLGIYGIARSLGDMVSQFGIKIGNAIIFPGIATSELRGDELRAKLATRRLQFVVVMLGGIAVFLALPDLIIRVLYDPRYFAAATVLPFVGLAAWLAILNTLGDSVLLGLGTPSWGAIGNAAKLGCLVLLLPLGLWKLGIVGAALVAVAAELVRYGCLMAGQTGKGVAYWRQDIGTTAAMLALAVAVRAAAHALGLTGSVADMLRLW